MKNMLGVSVISLFSTALLFCLLYFFTDLFYYAFWYNFGLLAIFFLWAYISFVFLFSIKEETDLERELTPDGFLFLIGVFSLIFFFIAIFLISSTPDFSEKVLSEKTHVEYQAYKKLWKEQKIKKEAPEKLKESERLQAEKIKKERIQKEIEQKYQELLESKEKN